MIPPLPSSLSDSYRFSLDFTGQKRYSKISNIMYMEVSHDNSRAFQNL